MAEAASKKLREAMADMVDDIDKSYIRRMQVRDGCESEAERQQLAAHTCFPSDSPCSFLREGLTQSP